MQKQIFPLLALLALFWGCYPGGGDYVDEFDIVLTNYDDNAAFSTMTTYSMPDSIVEIDDDSDPNNPEYIKGSSAAPILAAIRTNMKNYGWTEVNKLAKPDVILLPSAMQTTTISYYYGGGYWGWYYPYYPGGGWYYPGYYPPTYSSYTSGTLLVQMTNPNDPTEDDKIPVIWTGVINGLLTGSSASYNTRVTKNVNQMFTQSLYLKK